MVGIGLAMLLLITQASIAGAAPAVSFGARLTKDLQPSNAESGRTCAAEFGFPNNPVCTWVELDAYQRAGKHRAPRDGVIGTVKVISCVAYSFRVQILRVRPAEDKARAIRESGLLRVPADPRQIDGDEDTFCGGDDGDDYKIRSFRVNLRVKKGDWLGMKTRRTGSLRCSGGTNVLGIAPPLVPGGPFKTGETEDCFVLLEARLKAT
jgi:hypothetical protein